jgi:hypothetical protein
MPPQGKNTVTVVIEMENPNDRVSSLVVHQSPECSKSPYEFFVDQRVPQVSSDWVRVRSCSSSESMDLHTTCAMDLKGPRQIRLTFIAKPSVGISFLIIY